MTRRRWTLDEEPSGMAQHLSGPLGIARWRDIEHVHVHQKAFIKASEAVAIYNANKKRTGASFWNGLTKACCMARSRDEGSP